MGSAGTADDAAGGMSEQDGAGRRLVELAPLLSAGDAWRRFWPDLRPYRRRLTMALLLVAVAPVIETLTIALYGRLVDDVLVPRDFAALGPIAGAYVALTILGGILGFGRSYLSAWVGERFLLDLRTRLFRHLQQLPLHVLERRRLGDLTSRLNDDVDEIEGMLVSGVEEAISHLLRFLFFTAALFWIDWRLALVALIVAPPFWIAARRFAGRIKMLSREQRSRDGAINAVAEESLSNAPLVQAYNRQGTEAARFEREAVANFVAQVGLARLRALFSPLIDLLELGGILVVVAAGTWLLARGEMTLGGLLAFLAYLSQLYEPVRGLSRLVTGLGAATASAERVIEVLDEDPPVPQRADAVVLAPQPGGVHLELDGVGFRYAGSRQTALEGVSLRLAPGDSLALVGPTGAGKSTLLRLLLRFADPTSGAIRIDGHDLRDLDLASLRDRIAVVLQETSLFDGTIRENIAFGRAGATERQICDAARAADAHDFIFEFADGYETRVGQRGRSLSGGQRQRIAVARAMLRDAPLLILDEPTTGLDAESSERVLAPLSRLMRGRTTIIISHDPAVVRIAATVGVIEAGRLVEYGGANDLRAGDGAFARLFGPRAASADPEPDAAVDPLPVLVSSMPDGGTRIGDRGPAVLVAS